MTEIKSTIEENSKNYLKKKRADNESKKQKIEQVYQQCMYGNKIFVQNKLSRKIFL